MFYNKQWYNIYLGVLDLSNDISFVMIRLRFNGNILK